MHNSEAKRYWCLNVLYSVHEAHVTENSYHRA